MRSFREGGVLSKKYAWRWVGEENNECQSDPGFGVNPRSLCSIIYDMDKMERDAVIWGGHDGDDGASRCL